MSNGPRIVFMRFVSRGTSKLEPWVVHRQRVIGSSPPIAGEREGGADGSLVAWNLVSGNNRMLARSAALYHRLDDAISDATALVARTEALRLRPVSDELRGLYGWFGSVDQLPVITCSRWYLTERDRRSSMELSLVALGAAVVSSEARMIDPALTGRSS